MKLDSVVRRVLKAELHVHIEGTVTPGMARRKAKEHGITLPEDIFAPDGTRFVWKDFPDCVTRVYDAVASVVRTPKDYEDITYDYLKRCARENCIYVEMIISPDHCERMGVSYKDMVNAMARAIDRARAETGIEARMNAAIVRHLPQEQIEKAAQIIADYPHPYVTGLDLAGAEKEGDIPQFRPVFKKIKDRTQGRMGWRVHASEAAGPQNARDAVALNVKRLGHGVRTVEDEALVTDLVRKGTVLEVCPTSNILAGIYPDFAAHPLRRLKDAGVRVTLNSDDPGLFGNSIGVEYQVAWDHFGFTEIDLLKTTRTSIEAAFLDEPTRAALLKKVDDFSFFPKSRRGFRPAGP